MKRIWLLAVILLAQGAVQAGSMTDLKITTADGKSLKAPVRSFKGLSFGVMATLVKEGQMTNASAEAKEGHMTFVLDPSVSPDFLAWAVKSLSQGDSQSHKAGGSFMWVDPHGKATETFTLSGVKVFSYTAQNGGPATIVLTADSTVADPPIKFKNK